jgi:hypothetical protein
MVLQPSLTSRLVKEQSASSIQYIRKDYKIAYPTYFFWHYLVQLQLSLFNNKCNVTNEF